MIISKFVFQSYIMSMVTKSFLHNFAAKYQFYPFKLFENEEMAKLFDIYYKGFCPSPTEKENLFNQNLTLSIFISSVYFSHIMSFDRVSKAAERSRNATAW